ncbi:MAG: 4-(cytidine 5'-diphospho)-2-C-methyl-D-erythritol kinase [Oscillospiraceae bacterium]|nr:4-(cytidine 5'-diphospho)-2-C-methyl-D-erythritol kinase [Oscillospiraceae bacterium]
MKHTIERAYGKLNLTLDVTSKRPDGYHDVCMVMQTVALCDDLAIAVDSGAPWRCWCSDPSIPQGAENLAVKAATTFFDALGYAPDGGAIMIEKRIPAQGGMAGGSADAAAVLRALSRLYDHPFDRPKLRLIAAEVGSDVPFCLEGGTQLAEGRGEVLTPLDPMPKATILLVKPTFSVSTPALFAEIDRAETLRRPDTARAIAALASGDLAALAAQMQNVFQPLVAKSHPEVEAICQTMKAHGALGAQMTGTGSVVFGVFDQEAKAKQAQEACRAFGTTCLTAPMAQV